MAFSSTIFALTLGITVQSAPPTIANSPIFNGYADRWKSALEGFGAPSFSIVVVKGDEVILLDSMGLRDPFGQKPANPDTIYYIASITKTFTGLATVMLADQNRLKLDDPVQKYCKKFTLAKPEQAKAMTLVDLLSHKPGLDSDAVTLDAYTGEITDDRYYTFLSQISNGERPTYSNIHFTLLGRVLESIDKKGWKDVLQDRVFNPLGLSRTTAYASRMYGDANCAVPMYEMRGNQVLSPLIKTDNTMHAAGGIGTTARDFGRYLRFMINEGRLDGRQIVPASAIRDMLQKRSDIPQGSIRKMEGYGLAWNVGTYRGHRYAAHGGGYVGASAYVAFFPDDKIGCAVLCNSSAPLADILSIDVFDKLLEIKANDLVPGYLKQWQDRRETQKKTPLFGPNPALGGLSQPMNAYKGVFANSLWGTVTVSSYGGTIKVRFGEIDLILRSTGKDTFEAALFEGDDPVKCRFIVDGDRVKAIEMDRGSKVIFTRSK